MRHARRLAAPNISPAHRGRGDRYPRTDVQLNPQRETAAALTEIDHAETVAAADRDRTAGLAHDLLAVGFGQMPNAEIRKGGIPSAMADGDS